MSSRGGWEHGAGLGWLGSYHCTRVQNAQGIKRLNGSRSERKENVLLLSLCLLQWLLFLCRESTENSGGLCFFTAADGVFCLLTDLVCDFV